MITDCHWETGHPLARPAVGTDEAEPPGQVSDLDKERQQLDRMLSGFADWETEYTTPVAQLGR
jgi:hypothetical protein